jgi:hypothetical protein
MKGRQSTSSPVAGDAQTAAGNTALTVSLTAPAATSHHARQHHHQRHATDAGGIYKGSFQGIYCLGGRPLPRLMPTPVGAPVGSYALTGPRH